MFPFPPEVINLIIEACVSSHTFESAVKLRYINRTWMNLISSESIWRQLLLKNYGKQSLPPLYNSYYECFRNYYHKHKIWLSNRAEVEIFPSSNSRNQEDMDTAIEWHLQNRQIDLKSGDIVRVGFSNIHYIMTNIGISRSPISISNLGEKQLYSHDEFKFPKYPLSFWSDHYSNIILNVDASLFVNQIMCNLEGTSSYFEYKAVTYTIGIQMEESEDIRSFVLGGKWYYLAEYGSKHIVIASSC